MREPGSVVMERGLNNVIGGVIKETETRTREYETKVMSTVSVGRVWETTKGLWSPTFGV